LYKANPLRAGAESMQVIVHNQTRFWLIPTLLLWVVPYLNGQARESPSPIFKVDVDTVFVKVAVTDPLNRYITGLGKECFKVYEDNVQQAISHFSQQSAAISVGILFDVSTSMGSNNNIGIGKHWLTRFLDSSLWESRNPDDEYFLITFNHTVNLVQAFTDKTVELQNDIAFEKPSGWTALYDAVYRGLDHMKEGKNEKKALILISDGGDNKSRYKRNEVLEFLKESDVMIYGIGLQSPETFGYYVITSLTSLTGGRAFFSEPVELEYYINLIHAELRNQYLLGYVPTHKTHDGKWRQIRVKLDAPEGLPKMSIRAKKGYYAPKN
jgi:Ca-activated chloride channel homolog